MAKQMSDFVHNKFNNKLVVEEQRNFSNPHIRFRRIKGRVVPIFNKKRIGQDFNKVGASMIGTGALVTGAGLAKLYLKKKTKFKSSFSMKGFSGFNYKPKSKKGKVLKSIAKGTFKAGKFGFKHMTKMGLAATGLGIAASLYGTELQMQSMFGKDFFFVKDEHGRHN